MKDLSLALLVLWIFSLAEKVGSFQTPQYRTFSQRTSHRTSLGRLVVLKTRNTTLEISTAPKKARTSPLFETQPQSTDFGSSRWTSFPQRRSCLFASSTDADSEDENPAVGILSRMFSLLLLPLRLLLWIPLKRLISILRRSSSDKAAHKKRGEADNQVVDMAPVSSTAHVPIAISNEVVDDSFDVDTADDKADNQESTSDFSDEEDPLEEIMEESLEEDISEREVDITPVAPAGPVAVAISDVVVEDSMVEEIVTSSPKLSSKPAGNRWAVASDGVDLSGNWEVIVTDEFKEQYDDYLTKLGQPLLVRTFAMGIISFTTEEIKQSDNGRALLIRGKNLQGSWDRTLVSSGAEPGNSKYTPLHIPIMTADDEQVEAESWWEKKGSVHVSWLRNIAKYGGGAFESRRYLENDGSVYVCESNYFPDDKEREPCSITWRFKRIDTQEE